jgi:hypothetical protein
MVCCCCSTASWKEEQVEDFKFSYIDIDQFRLKSFYYRFKYCLLFIIVMKGILVYMADIYTVVHYLALDGFTANPGLDSLNSKWSILVHVMKWVYLGSIFISLLILLLEIKKSRKITRSGYISCAFTNTMSYRQYAISSYSYYSFFQRIEMYIRPIDRMAFFVFFSLKGKLEEKMAGCEKLNILNRLQTSYSRPVASSCHRRLLCILTVPRVQHHNRQNSFGQSYDRRDSQMQGGQFLVQHWCQSVYTFLVCAHGYPVCDSTPLVHSSGDEDPRQLERVLCTQN